MKKIPKALVVLAIIVLAGTAAGCGTINRVLEKDHVHSFVPVYRTVYHDAVTHTEDQGHYEIVMVQGARYEEYNRSLYWLTCSCGWHEEEDFFSEVDDVWKKHAREMADAGETACAAYKSRLYTKREIVKISDPIYEDVWVPQLVTVVDQEAYEERILDRKECSCGAVQ